MGILSNLEPKRVFEIFEEMCAIPHGSTNTKAISDWCVAFGEKLGLEHYQDCLLYTSPSPRDQRGSRMPSSA